MKTNDSDTQFKTRLEALALFVAAKRLSSFLVVVVFFAGLHMTGTAGQQGRVRRFCFANATFKVITFTEKVTFSQLRLLLRMQEELQLK